MALEGMFFVTSFRATFIGWWEQFRRFSAFALRLLPFM